MTRTTRLPTWLAALIALSMLTTGLAVVSGSTATAEGDAESSPTYRSPAHVKGESGPRGLTLTGNVTHAETGEPLEGLEISLENRFIDRRSDPAERGFERSETTTDEDGRYAVNVSYGHVRLSIDDPRFQGIHASFEMQDNLTLDIPVRPVNESLATVEGQVTDKDGQPLEDASVSVRAMDRVHCEGDVCHAERTSRADSDHVVHVDDETIVIRYEPRTDRHAWTQTDASGAYSVRVLPGSYAVEARAHEHLEERTEVEFAENGTAQADLSLTPIPPDSVAITGTVRDAETGDPIPYAEVTVQNDVWGAYNHTRADEDGSYAIGTKPGHAIVSVRADERYWVPCEEPRTEPVADDDAAASKPRPACDGSRERDQAYLPRVASFTPDADETIELSPELERSPGPDATFSGWVVNASSEEGVPNATVTFRNEETNEWGRVQTDADGSYSIDVRAGYYTIHVRAPDHLSNATNERIEVGEDQRLTLEVEPGETRHDRCCFAYAERSTGASMDADGAAGDDGENRDVAHEGTADRATASDTPDGRQAFEGSSGGLGPYPGAETNSDGGTQATPLPSVLGTIALVGLGAAALKLYRPRDR